MCYRGVTILGRAKAKNKQTRLTQTHRLERGSVTVSSHPVDQPPGQRYDVCAVFLPILLFKPRAVFQAAYTPASGRQFNQVAKTSVDVLQHSPGLCQSLSGAAPSFHVAVVRSALVNWAFGL